MSSASRTNGRPALRISTLPALHLELPESGAAWLVCPDCHSCVEVVRGLVQTHKPDGTRCAGSAQRLTFDLTPARHAARRAVAQRELETHATRRISPARTLREGAAPAARLAVTRRDRRRVEVKARTSMVIAFEAAFEQIGRVPVAPALHQIAARRTQPTA